MQTPHLNIPRTSASGIVHALAARLLPSAFLLTLLFVVVPFAAPSARAQESTTEKKEPEKKDADNKDADSETQTAAPENPTPKTPAQRAADATRQDSDDEVTSLPPSTTDKDDPRQQAAAWFMTGQARESQKNVAAAIAAYQKAIELDPSAYPAYKALIPLAFSTEQFDLAVGYAEKAVNLKPDDHTLRRRLAAEFARVKRLPKAIELLEAGVNQTWPDPRPLDFYMIQRDLGLFTHLAGQPDKAAVPLETLFRFLKSDEFQKLDTKVRKELQGEPARTFESMGEIFLAAKKPDLAVEAFEESLKHNKRSPGIHGYNLASVYRQMGQPEKALAELQKYLDAQLQSKGPAAYQLLKELLGELKRPDELLPTLQALAEKDRHNPALRYFLADELTTAGKLEDAEKLYRSTLTEFQDFRGHLGLVQVYRRQSDAEQLLVELSRGFQTLPRPDDPQLAARIQPELIALSQRFENELQSVAKDSPLMDKLVELGRKKMEGDDPDLDFIQAYLLGRLSIAGKKTDAAIDFYKFTISARNEPAATLFNELGEHLLEVERFQDATDIYREAAEHPNLEKQRPLFLYFLSRTLALQGEVAESLNSIREAQELQSENPGFKFEEAWILSYHKRWDEAEKILKDLIASNPPNPELLRLSKFALSNVYVQKGDMAAGQKILEDMLVAEPNHPQVNNDLGYLLAEEGRDLERAKSMIEKAVTAEPENAAYIDSLGWILFRLGKFDDALKQLETARDKHEKGDPTIWEHLGDCYEKLNRPDDARKAWKQAQELESKKRSIDQKLLDRVNNKLSAPPSSSK